MAGISKQDQQHASIEAGFKKVIKKIGAAKKAAAKGKPIDPKIAKMAGGDDRGSKSSGKGSGKFDSLVAKLKQQDNVRDPEALAHWIGLRKGGLSKKESISDAMESLLSEAEAKVTCEECGEEIVVEEAKEQGNGRLLCEKCYGAMERGEASEKYAKLVKKLRATAGRT
jgi:hypothetical protein